MRNGRTKRRHADEYLVVAARLGDRRALGLLARSWNGKFLAHAWRLLADSESARDAVQESWTEIVRGITNLSDPAAFPAWAYRIVSRRCARQIANARRRRRLSDAVSAESGAESDDPVDAGDTEKLRAAVRQLPAGQRAAVALFYLEEMSVAETAVALDVPVGTVKSRLMHARQKLRAALKGDEDAGSGSND